MKRQFFVYLMASYRGTLYTGVTNNLERRIEEHRGQGPPGFTAKYNVGRLVYFEETDNPEAAVNREREIKGWTRAKKAALIESTNPYWRDLTDDWEETAATPDPSLRSG